MHYGGFQFFPVSGRERSDLPYDLVAEAIGFAGGGVAGGEFGYRVRCAPDSFFEYCRDDAAPNGRSNCNQGDGDLFAECAGGRSATNYRAYFIRILQFFFPLTWVLNLNLLDRSRRNWAASDAIRNPAMTMHSPRHRRIGSYFTLNCLQMSAPICADGVCATTITPLMERLKREAPVRFFHSLSRDAAEDAPERSVRIRLKAKAGALFHDIGKLSMRNISRKTIWRAQSNILT